MSQNKPKEMHTFNPSLFYCTKTGIYQKKNNLKHTKKNFWSNNQPWHLYTEWSGFLWHNTDTSSISSFLSHVGSHSFPYTLAGRQKQTSQQYIKHSLAGDSAKIFQHRLPKTIMSTCMFGLLIHAAMAAEKPYKCTVKLSWWKFS